MGFTIAGSKVVRIMGKEYSGMRIEEPTVGGTVTGVTSTTGEAAETIPTHTLTIPATEIRVNFVSAVSGIPTLRNCMVDFTGLTLSADL